MIAAPGAGAYAMRSIRTESGLAVMTKLSIGTPPNAAETDCSPVPENGSTPSETVPGPNASIESSAGTASPSEVPGATDAT